MGDFAIYFNTTCPQNQYNFDAYSHTYYENTNLVEAFFSDAMRAFREVAATLDDFKAYLPKIDNLIENFCEVGRRCYVKNAPGNGFNVLNHGDFHLRNLLGKFNGESQRLEKFQFVNFQFRKLLIRSLNWLNNFSYRLTIKFVCTARQLLTWATYLPLQNAMMMAIFMKTN